MSQRETALITCRMIARRFLLSVVGPTCTRRVHGLYHALLRRTGGFGVPETQATQDLLSCLTAQAGTILDVGANIGRYSWFMARHCRKGVRLYGFEPNPNAYTLARQNLAKLPDITLLPIGLGDTDRETALVVPHDATGAPVSGLGFVLHGGSPPIDCDVEPVILKTLDGLIAQGGVVITSPVLIKIDIEGHEPAALAGMADCLAQHRPWIFFECEPHHLQRAGYDWPDLFLPLQRQGYHIFAETAGRFEPVQQPIPGGTNYFALHPETLPPEVAHLIR